jgi:hypothetical protein
LLQLEARRSAVHPESGSCAQLSASLHRYSSFGLLPVSKDGVCGLLHIALCVNSGCSVEWWWRFRFQMETISGGTRGVASLLPRPFQRRGMLHQPAQPLPILAKLLLHLYHWLSLTVRSACCVVCAAPLVLWVTRRCCVPVLPQPLWTLHRSSNVSSLSCPTSSMVRCGG